MSQTVIDKLKTLLNNKNSVRDALIQKGVKNVTEVFSTYGDLIKSIETRPQFSYPQFKNDQQPLIDQNTTIAYVSDDGDDHQDDAGSSWEKPFKTIQTALNYGVNIIYIKQGTYPLNASIQLYDDVKIYGGFSKENPLWETRNPFKQRSVFDANGKSYGFIFYKNAFTNLNSQINLLLDGICVINCIGNEVSGFYSNSYMACCKNCLSINCQQISEQSFGGGFTFKRSSILENCVALNCVSQGNGGGFWFRSDSKVNNCYAINCKAKLGGGFYLHRMRTSTGQLKNCCMSSCKAYDNGGGLYVYENSTSSNNFLVDNLIVLDCHALTHGAAIYSDTSHLLIRNSVCINNDALYSILYVNNSSIINCSIIKNKVNSIDGYPCWIQDTNNTYCLNNICFDNKNYNMQKVCYYVGSNSSLIMKKNSGDGNNNYYGQQYVDIINKIIYNFYFNNYWNLPIGYASINDMKNDLFGSFIPNDSQLINQGYYQDGIVPLYDVYNKQRTTEPTIGAFQTNNQEVL